jgi:hypothetical protein
MNADSQQKWNSFGTQFQVKSCLPWSALASNRRIGFVAGSPSQKGCSLVAGSEGAKATGTCRPDRIANDSPRALGLGSRA